MDKIQILLIWVLQDQSSDSNFVSQHIPLGTSRYYSISTVKYAHFCLFPSVLSFTIILGHLFNYMDPTDFFFSEL